MSIRQTLASQTFIGSRYIVRHGHAYSPAPFKGRYMRRQACFMNAFRYCCRTRSQAQGLLYVEGYVAIRLSAKRVGLIPHAWAAHPARPNVAIDPTPMACEPVEYFGVPFTIREAEPIMYARGIYGVLPEHISEVSAIAQFDPRMRALWEEMRQSPVTDVAARPRGLDYPPA